VNALHLLFYHWQSKGILISVYQVLTEETYLNPTVQCRKW